MSKSANDRAREIAGEFSIIDDDSDLIEAIESQMTDFSNDQNAALIVERDTAKKDAALHHFRGEITAIALYELAEELITLTGEYDSDDDKKKKAHAKASATLQKILDDAGIGRDAA